VETALVLPALLLLAFGVLGAARVTQAQMGVSAVSREAARAGALGVSPVDAVTRGTVRGRDVAAGYHLTNGSLQLTVDPGAMARGGQVQAVARYELTFDDLPLLSGVRVAVQSGHAEPIDPYRSRQIDGVR
jgi:Flp pilus assembly protein TadG